ncbi:MAG TPA: aminopeptidase [Oligoflexia bacterium]|nr:aminopeptidase [Oligoflexia bacterium]HMP49269.1 aminopeptidase [Oligoflexia bacterium]
MNNQEFLIKRKRYAQLLVRFGLNVEKGQVVNISSEAYLRDFALEVLEASYLAGARYVNLELTDPRALKCRILNSSEEYLSYVPPYISEKYRELVDDRGANLKIIGSEAPEILVDLPPKKINDVRLAQFRALKYFYDEGIGKSGVQWTVAAASTPQWAKKLFPELSESDAEMKLWEHLFSICRLEDDNFLERWYEHDKKLHERADYLNSMKIEYINFIGPGTDLKVKLSPKAVFKGGSDMGPRGGRFEPNIPTEEVFTTPDWRGTSGHVKTTRPFLVNGTLIKDLHLEFVNGEIKSFAAEAGESTFAEYISSDEGAKRLGELALVGIDSPIYQSGVVFEEILLDENAACHIAIGRAYRFCVEGGTDMSEDEADAIGCNDSSVHTDMMISSEEVDVKGTTFDGREILLLEKGEWRV